MTPRLPGRRCESWLSCVTTMRAGRALRAVARVGRVEAPRARTDIAEYIIAFIRRRRGVRHLSLALIARRGTPAATAAQELAATPGRRAGPSAAALISHTGISCELMGLAAYPASAYPCGPGAVPNSIRPARSARSTKPWRRRRAPDRRQHRHSIVISSRSQPACPFAARESDPPAREITSGGRGREWSAPSQRDHARSRRLISAPG